MHLPCCDRFDRPTNVVEYELGLKETFQVNQLELGKREFLKQYPKRETDHGLG